MKSKVTKILFLLIIIFVGVQAYSIFNKEKKYEKSKFLFGTYIKIIVYSKNKSLAETSISKAFDEIERIDRKFNSKSKNSLIYNLNNSSDKILELDDETKELFSKIKKAYDDSKTKYDITIVPLVELWGFSHEKQRVGLPTSQEIKTAKEKIGFDKISFKEDKMYLNKNIEIDTGSFLKGYAISKAGKILKQLGVKKAFISSISSLVTIGTKPKNKKWKIGIQNPSETNKLLGIIDLSDESMGVSGDYQTYIEIKGQKYHHILDKTTGYPVKDKKMVVVVTKNSFLADLYSTMFFLMPIKDIFSFVEKKKNIKVLVVDKDMNVMKSKNFVYEKNK